MVRIGQRNLLRITRESPQGVYLDGAEHGEILLPRRYAPRGAGPGAEVDAFLYLDSEDRLIATTETPKAMVGEFACLRVIESHPGIGAFLDWGLRKDLLLPIREQQTRVRAGEDVVVFVYLDEASGRIVATTRLGRHLDPGPPSYAEGQEVDLLIAGETPLGLTAIINGAHRGLLYRGETGAPPRIGQRLKGYIRAVRPDGKIDLGLDAAGYTRIGPLAEQILVKLKTAGGRLPLDDQSSPEAIREALGCSKKAFKQAVGALYSARRIRLAGGGIEWAESR